ncbi:hypothetical protein HPB50_015021 [Hyalomma asiaticum]|uniref:Uncharacterized protein n=1 Tax=Hyalomma asiaticum TaxID=266040 RepID=A0ACB7SR30_HYAAI|nr:hypothetical protein HPB50_015021 [Hyalomma asiaticum]
MEQVSRSKLPTTGTDLELREDDEERSCVLGIHYHRRRQHSPDSTPVSSAGEITPVRVRTSRCLQGLQAEHGPLTHRVRTMDLDPQPSAAPFPPVHQVIVNQPQTLAVSHGDQTKMYQNVTTYHTATMYATSRNQFE